MDYILTDINKLLQPNLVSPTKKPENRNEFWDDYKLNGIKFIIEKYGNEPQKTKFQNFISKFKYKLKRIIKN